MFTIEYVAIAFSVVAMLISGITFLGVKRVAEEYKLDIDELFDRSFTTFDRIHDLELALPTPVELNPIGSQPTEPVNVNTDQGTVLRSRTGII